MPKKPKPPTFPLDTPDWLATLKCIKSDPPMHRDSQSLLDPCVTCSVWVYDCNDAFCPECTIQRDVQRFGFEDLYSDSDSEDESEVMSFNLVLQQDEYACDACHRNTRSGFKYSSFGRTMFRCCCDSIHCKSDVSENIKYWLPISGASTVMEEVE